MVIYELSEKISIESIRRKTELFGHSYEKAVVVLIKGDFIFDKLSQHSFPAQSSEFSLEFPCS